MKVQNTFLGQTGVRTLFMIELTTDRAREIHIYSDYPDEKEVLLPPNSRFVVSLPKLKHTPECERESL